MAKKVSTETEVVNISPAYADMFDEKFVAVNNKRYLVKVGEDVEVPKPVAEVVKRMIRQQEKTRRMISGLEKKYSEGVSKI